LADKNDEEERVQAAFDHLREVELSIQPFRVISFADQIRRFEVDVRVDGDDLFVNGAGFVHQGIFAD
jgi:hypothetical protein